MEALASVYLEMGSTKDTLGLLLRILTSKTVQMGTDHPDTLTVLENVADMYLVDSEYVLCSIVLPYSRVHLLLACLRSLRT